MLKDIYRKPPVTDRNHIIDFGRYNGKSVDFVVEADPQWLWWAHHETDRFELGHELLTEIEDRTDWKP